MSKKESIEVCVHTEALANVLGVKSGDTLTIQCRNGVPVSREWRNRLKDAEVDGCVSIVHNTGSKSKKGEGK